MFFVRLLIYVRCGRIDLLYLIYNHRPGIMMIIGSGCIFLSLPVRLDAELLPERKGWIHSPAAMLPAKRLSTKVIMISHDR